MELAECKEQLKDFRAEQTDQLQIKSKEIEVVESEKKAVSDDLKQERFERKAIENLLKDEKTKRESIEQELESQRDRMKKIAALMNC